jgi:uncharacterized protein (DUF2147 family)
MKKRVMITATAAAALLSGLTEVRAESSPVGVWIDSKGRGAIEIKECGRKMLCGHVVWVRNKSEQHGCGRQLLGDVRSVGGGEWDHGWIVDPDDLSKYDVALRRMSRTKLKVTGYMGSKIFSRDLIWKRAPDNLQRCDGIEEKKETIIASRPDTTEDSGPRAAPAPDRNPMLDRFDVASADISLEPPAPVPAVRPAKRDTAEHGKLSKAAREALDVLAVRAEGDRELVSVNVPPRKVASRRKTCTVRAPFVTVSFPCDR